MGSRRSFLIRQIVEICQKLDQKGFTANHDGNVSARFEDGLLATPTAESKAAIVEAMIITLDMEGKKREGIGQPFSEIKLHLAAYRARPDAKAVVHAHPPFCTARGLVNQPIHPALPEAVVSIGAEIPVAPFAMPGAPENDDIVRDALHIADVFMMPGNGVLSIGDDLEQAWLRLELAEHIAKIEFYAKQMGQPMSLAPKDLEALLKKRASLKLGPQNRPLPAPSAPAPQPPAASAPSKEDKKPATPETPEASKAKDANPPDTGALSPTTSQAESQPAPPPAPAIDPTQIEALVLEEVRKLLQGNS